MSNKVIVLLTFIAILLISNSVDAQTIDVSCAPSSAGTGSTISVPVSISNSDEINAAFGAHLTFNTGFFQYQGTDKGDLTQTWADVDGGLSGNTVTFGGYRGAGNIIPAGSSGTIAVLTFLVTCGSCSNGQTTQICIDNYMDDITGYTPEPDCTTFTFTVTYPACQMVFCKYDSECQNCCLGSFLCDDTGTCDPFSDSCDIGLCYCSTGCGAECGTSSDCSSKCVGETRYYNGWCDTACSCHYDTTDCTTRCYDTCHEKHCSGGNCNNQGTDCGPYKCSTGTGCTTTCEIDCGANCENNNNCNYCSGDTRYYGYNCNSACNCAGGSTQNCANLFGQRLCTTDKYWQTYASGDCATGGICDSGTGNPTCHGDRVPGGWHNCDTDNACSGSCPGCLYDEYVCSGLSCTDVRGDEGPEGVCCATGTGRGSGVATCTVGASHDPDLNTGVCTGGVCCSTPVADGGCGLHWAVGGSGDCTGNQCLTNCCGDDSSENYAYRRAYKTANQYHIAWNDVASDDTCCNSSEDCVFGGICYSTGAQTSGFNPGGDDNYAKCRSGGIHWLDIDYGSAACAASSLNWVTAGETGVGEYGSSTDGGDGTTECCGDDASEYFRTQKGHGNNNVQYGNIAWVSGTTRCCDNNDNINYNDVCITSVNTVGTGQAIDTGYNGADKYSVPYYNGGASHGWLECDYYAGTTSWCQNVCSGGYVFAGESGVGEYQSGSQTNGYHPNQLTNTYGYAECCGDDLGEEYRTATDYSTTYSMTWNTGQTACCDDDNDCIDRISNCVTGMYTGDYGNPTTGLNPGGNDNIAFPFNNNGAANYCRWLDCDHSDFGERWCRGHCGPTSPIGGDWTDNRNRPYAGEAGVGEYPDTSTRGCCGDDASEYYRYFMTDYDESPDSSPSCNDITDEDCINGGDDTSDDRCCNDDDDCVYNGVCYTENSYVDLNGNGRIDGWCMTSDSYKGHWRDCDDLEGNCNGGCGANWVPGGEDFGFGEYDSGSETECCGDDAGEEHRTQECDLYACTSDPNIEACCDNQNDCVAIVGSEPNCFDNGDPLPGNPDATCVNGVWRDTTAPTTRITPNGGNFTGSNETSFTLTCTDTGGSGCANTYYKIINDGQVCGTTGFTQGSSGDVTCPFGQTCYKRVCFYSTDNAGNQETTNQSEVFILKTDACLQRQCGQTCLVITGVCDGPEGNCYADGGCLLDCSVPSVSPPDERRWLDSTCGRTGSYKCNTNHVCSNSYTSCITGGSSTQVTGTWSSYQPPSGYYDEGDSFQIRINGVSNQPSAFTILTECGVYKYNGDIIYFNNWGSGNLAFSYTIQTTDPEGVWTTDYCSLWSDFEPNAGWNLRLNGTNSTFIVDKTPPIITIHSPIQNSEHNSDFPVNATVRDTWSQVSSVEYRWENTTDNGNWVYMPRQAGTDFYSEIFDISNLADGNYTIRVRASDILLHTSERTVNIKIDTTPPTVSIQVPSSNTWYNTDFTVRALVRDLQGTGVSSVEYRWESMFGPDIGPWTPMVKDIPDPDDPIWVSISPFSVSSVEDGRYRFRVRAFDNVGNQGMGSATGVGIDDENPYSYVYPLPELTTETKFNISWTGQDNESGIDCYLIQYRYNDTQNLTSWINLTFAGGNCTGQTETEFDAVNAAGTSNINKYIFYFRSLARDNAGNQEIKTTYDTNTTMFIPVLTNVYAIDTMTGLVIPNKGKTSADRIVRIISTNKTPGVGRLNFTLTYYNHTPLSHPSTGTRYEKTENNSYSINLTAGPYTRKMQVSYRVYATTVDGSQDEWNPLQPYYWHFTMYTHPLANFLVKGDLYSRLGRSELIGIEVRNIQTSYDQVYLELDSEFVVFLDSGNQSLIVNLNPSEERIIYARLYPSGLESYTLNLHANSLLADPTLEDSDSLRIVIFMPADFPGMNFFGICLLLILVVLIYLKFVSRK